MSKKWITILVAAVIGALLLPSAAMAACRLQVVNSVAYTDSVAANSGADPQPFVAGDNITKVTGSVSTVAASADYNINAEGLQERVADLLITDDTLGTFCFTTGADLVITYNAIMTSPTTPGTLNIPGNLDIFDSKGIGGLTVTSATVSQVFAANTTNSQLDIHIGQTGTTGDLTVGPAGAALRVKNIRINASLTAGAGAFVTATFLGTSSPVALVEATVGASSILTVGTATGGVAVGVQSSNAGLAQPQTVSVTQGFASNQGASFRRPGATACNSRTTSADGCYSQVANDISTVATSLVFSVTGIPSGVTVTFPTTMSMSAQFGNGNSLSFNAPRTSTFTNNGAPGALTAIYDNSNVKGENLAANFLTVETADHADGGTAAGASSANPNCTSAGANLNSGSFCDNFPKIGVKVGAVSQSGTANLWWVFGQGQTGSTPQFVGDDIAASSSVIPQYAGARTIIKNKPFFTILPTRTTLLFPFVSTFGNFNTGISIINSGNDAGVFTAAASSTQIGGVTLFFFGVNPTTGAAVTDSVNSDLTATGGTNISAACRGLDANGRVVSGSGMACNVAALLPLLPSKPATFDGYVIAVTSFTLAHGYSAQFNGSGAPYAANEALVLSGTGARGGAGESLGN